MTSKELDILEAEAEKAMRQLQKDCQAVGVPAIAMEEQLAKLLLNAAVLIRRELLQNPADPQNLRWKKNLISQQPSTVSPSGQ